MIRSDTWHSDLFDYLNAVAHKPLVWGEHDCALFAAGAVRAMTGKDFAKGWRGRYDTLQGGLKLLKRKGFGDHAELAASLFEEIHPSQAAVGDIAAVPVEDLTLVALGVVQGERVFVLHPDRPGIATVDLMAATRAFRV